jgi:hypothetical protein
MDRVCIYCREQNKEFNREHVIPEAFGSFEGNFVLHESVCAECNSYFGRTLDLILSRDSGEALLRLRYGIKPAAQAKDLRTTRVRLTVNVSGPWYGTQIILTADETGTKLGSEQLPQVGFRKPPSIDFVWFTEDQLSESQKFEQYKQGSEIKIVGPSEEAVQRLGERLIQLDINFEKKGTLDQPVSKGAQIETIAKYQIDPIILRAIGKIALNYAAYTKGATFALRQDFNDFRNYVRYGTEPEWKPAILPSSKPILFDDSFKWKQTNGHIITLDWAPRNRGILAQVSLFNSVTYHALLCPRASGLWYPLACGHHFDIDSHKISALGNASAIKLVMAPKF